MSATICPDGVPGVSGGSAAESRTPFFIVGHGKLDTATLVKGQRQLQLNGGVLTQALARGLLQATGTVGRTSKFGVPSCLRYTAQSGGRCSSIGSEFFMGFSTHGSRWTLQDGTSWSTPKQEDDSLRHGLVGLLSTELTSFNVDRLKNETYASR